MTRQELERCVQPLVEELGYELVQVQASRTKRRHSFRVFLDKETGLCIKDCAFLSRRIMQVLDQDPALVGAYSLEVSSPGMNRPIWTLPHFERFRGERVRLLLKRPVDGRLRWDARIAGVDGQRVRLELEGHEEHGFLLDEIEEARLDLDPWKTPRGSSGA